MMSSDSTLHTIHMDGAASFNLPFPFPDRPTSRTMATPGLVNLRCNGGHVWMNAEMMIVKHPYYAVTDESGRFTFTEVPPGTYQIVAWHEGWGLAGKEQAYDVLTERSVQSAHRMPALSRQDPSLRATPRSGKFPAALQ